MGRTYNRLYHCGNDTGNLQHPQKQHKGNDRKPRTLTILGQISQVEPKVGSVGDRSVGPDRGRCCNWVMGFGSAERHDTVGPAERSTTFLDRRSDPRQWARTLGTRNMNKILGGVQYSVAPIQINTPLFQQNVDVQPYALTHGLQNHPLLRLENLVELAKRLPPLQREYVFAKQEFGTHEAGEHYEHAGSFADLSTEEMILNIEAQNRVIVLRNVETDSVYGHLVHEILDQMQSQIEAVTGPISGRESFIFISPPHAYTPFHYDPEQNFFLQILGRKDFAVYDVADRDVMPEVALENFLANSTRTPCSPEYFNRYRIFELTPGNGVYVPTTAPHWVRTLDEVSISISINFRTPSSIRRDRVCRFNRLLRKTGLQPQPVSPRADTPRDRIKAGLFEIPSKLRRLITLGK
jgi:hypothetical protein